MKNRDYAAAIGAPESVRLSATRRAGHASEAQAMRGASMTGGRLLELDMQV